MRIRFAVLAIVVLAAGLLVASLAGASRGKSKAFEAKLKGFREAPSISTGASGSVKLWVDADDQVITFRLRFRDLSTPSLFAHIHLGQKDVNGGVSAFFCGGGGKPACPTGNDSEAVVSGTIVPTDIVGPAGQGIAAGEFDELVHAIKAGVTYANVHSEMFPGGEIRGQIERG
jgi:hypothetical protein